MRSSSRVSDGCNLGNVRSHVLFTTPTLGLTQGTENVDSKYRTESIKSANQDSENAPDDERDTLPGLS